MIYTGKENRELSELKRLLEVASELRITEKEKQSSWRQARTGSDEHIYAHRAKEESGPCNL